MININLQVRNSLKGIGIGLILSIIITFFVVAIGSGSIGGSFEMIGWLWMFQTSAVPFMLCCGISGYFLGFKSFNKLKFWLISAIMGYASVCYMGTIGAIITSASKFGLENINGIGYLQGAHIRSRIFAYINTNCCRC